MKHVVAARTIKLAAAEISAKRTFIDSMIVPSSGLCFVETFLVNHFEGVL